ncbi:MAG: hypothetical protein GAK45_01739 [Pseudomonas citronellolis]|nr:MAG: hypothetical protein GAK45_01739 [Pseudomonas citronellolis]
MSIARRLLGAVVCLLPVGGGVAQDIDPQEIQRLRQAGTLRSVEALDHAALGKHPGGTVYDSELELEHGRYLYKVDVQDAHGVAWDVELDAVSGEVLLDRQDP